MAHKHAQPRPAPLPMSVRHIMRRLGISESHARSIAPLAYGEAALDG
jgi:hypothetical protein